MLSHTPPPGAIVGKWLWNSVHYLWDSECVFKMWYMDMQVFGHWWPLRKQLWNSLQHSWASEHVSSHEAHGQAGVCYPRPFESNCIISFLKTACTTLVFGCLPCFIWYFVLVPHLLYWDDPLVQRGDSALLEYEFMWGDMVIIWAQVCLTDTCIAYLSPFFASHMITFSMKWLFYWVTMPHVMQWLVEMFAKVGVAWIIIPLPRELYLSVLSQTPVGEPYLVTDLWIS